MTAAERAFVERSVRRKRVFLGLSIAGVSVAVLLVGFYGYQRWTDPAYPLGARSVIVLLVLLNARQNLRQYRYATALEQLMGQGGRSSSPDRE